MARTVGKRSAKPSTPAPSTVPPPTPATSPPEPFKRLPLSIQPLASTLPTHHIYLVHLDKTPADVKRRLFGVPILLNLAITLGLCLRIYHATPVYLQQIITVFGYDTPYKVDTNVRPFSELLSITTTRFLLLTFDFALFRLLGSWPKEFVFGSKSSRSVGPVGWRQKVWFQETEVIVRKGRMWDTPLLVGNDDTNMTWSTQDELTIKFKIEPAMQPASTGKSALMLLDKNYDLDYKGMIDAHRMIKDGRLKIEDLDGIALIFYQKQWLMWKVREDKEMPITDPVQENILEKFKKKLTDLGQEDVFFRWIEIVQYETSQPGGFTESRQTEAMRELKKLLTDRRVDYSTFWDEIGGQKGLPGFTQRSEG